MVPLDLARLSIRKYPETSFTFQNKFYKNLGTSHKFEKNGTYELKKKKMNRLFRDIF